MSESDPSTEPSIDGFNWVPQTVTESHDDDTYRDYAVYQFVDPANENNAINVRLTYDLYSAYNQYSARMRAVRKDSNWPPSSYGRGGTVEHTLSVEIITDRVLDREERLRKAAVVAQCLLELSQRQEVSGEQ